MQWTSYDVIAWAGVNPAALLLGEYSYMDAWIPIDPGSYQLDFDFFQYEFNAPGHVPIGMAAPTPFFFGLIYIADWIERPVLVDNGCLTTRDTVPEPTCLVLVGCGLAALAARKLRRRRF